MSISASFGIYLSKASTSLICCANCLLNSPILLPLGSLWWEMNTGLKVTFFLLPLRFGSLADPSMNLLENIDSASDTRKFVCLLEFLGLNKDDFWRSKLESVDKESTFLLGAKIIGVLLMLFKRNKLFLLTVI